MSSNGPARLAGNLVKVAGTSGTGQARLLGVRPVVQADREDLARFGHWATEVVLDERRARRRDRRCRGAEGVPLVVHRTQVGPERPSVALATSATPPPSTIAARPATLASFMPVASFVVSYRGNKVAAVTAVNLIAGAGIERERVVHRCHPRDRDVGCIRPVGSEGDVVGCS